MANKFGPTRGELWFRLAVGIGGLGFVIFAVAHRGLPTGPALLEVVGVGGMFFAGTIVWSGWQLWKDRAD